MALLDVDKIVAQVRGEIEKIVAEKLPTAIEFAKAQQEALTEYTDDAINDLNSSLAFVAFAATANKFIVTEGGKAQYRKGEHVKAFAAITEAFNEATEASEAEAEKGEGG